ncbi:DUF3604 domain-containing protein [Formosa haliotis]|uniref:DUF3604 domain-containing protein n=1 Tax=Formosa haliotis TaxID=1555194 RepID=UPI000826E7A7|nr:DUF3604 domain-containing protein [Formosa haliotis]
MNCKNHDKQKDENINTTEAIESEDQITQNPLKDVYFGNLHVHTSWSFDGYTNGSVTGPEDAYRWAQGEAIPGGGAGGELKILKPLDWYAVSDHAEYLGIFPKLKDPNNPMSKLDIAKRASSDDQVVAFAAYNEILNGINESKPDPNLNDPEIVKSIWQEVVAIADKHNQPGKFTTFPAYEWTSNPGSQNLHRVVLLRILNICQTYLFQL